MSARTSTEVPNAVSCLRLCLGFEIEQWVGALMTSTPSGNPSLLKPVPGLSYNLLPYKREEDKVKLVEFTLPADSSALPHSSLYENFYTG